MIKSGQLFYAFSEVAWLLGIWKQLLLSFCSHPCHHLRPLSSLMVNLGWGFSSSFHRKMQPNILWFGVMPVYTTWVENKWQKKRKAQNKREKGKREGPYEQAHCSLLFPWQMEIASASTVLDGSLLFFFTSIFWNDAGKVLLVRLAIYTMIIQ